MCELSLMTRDEVGFSAPIVVSRNRNVSSTFFWRSWGRDLEKWTRHHPYCVVYFIARRRTARHGTIYFKLLEPSEQMVDLLVQDSQLTLDGCVSGFEHSTDKTGAH